MCGGWLAGDFKRFSRIWCLAGWLAGWLAGPLAGGTGEGEEGRGDASFSVEDNKFDVPQIK